MPLPETISIKRKAIVLDGDDGDSHGDSHLQVLHIQNEISGRSDDSKYVYVKKRSKRSRQDDEARVSSPPLAICPPNLEGNPSFDAPTTTTVPILSRGTIPVVTYTTQQLQPHNGEHKSQKKALPTRPPLQRYHMSRESFAIKRPHSPHGVTKSGSKAGKHARLVFEARSLRRQPPQAAVVQPWTIPEDAQPARSFDVQPDTPTASPHLQQDVPHNKSTSPHQTQPADSQPLSYSISDDELSIAAQQYARDLVVQMPSTAATPDRALKRRPKEKYPPLVKSGTAIKYKPNLHVKRYFERHPEDPAAQPKTSLPSDDLSNESLKTEMRYTNVGDEHMDVDEDESSFVLDEFVRMPIEELALIQAQDRGGSQVHDVGVLVLDEREDIELFYGGDSDDESDIYDEEEDENAENHHSTDYPDDEVSSDDEFGRNPYLYRNKNASDEEEFDEHDAVYSEEEGDDEHGGIRGWNSRPEWLRRVDGKDANGSLDNSYAARGYASREEMTEMEEWG